MGLGLIGILLLIVGICLLFTGNVLVGIIVIILALVFGGGPYYNRL